MANDFFTIEKILLLEQSFARHTLKKSMPIRDLELEQMIDMQVKHPKDPNNGKNAGTYTNVFTFTIIGKGIFEDLDSQDVFTIEAKFKSIVKYDKDDYTLELNDVVFKEHTQTDVFPLIWHYWRQHVATINAQADLNLPPVPLHQPDID